MRIAVVMSRAEYEAREAVLAEAPDAYERADAAFHEMARKVDEADTLDTEHVAIDLYVENEAGPRDLLSASYLYTIVGPAPGEDEGPWSDPFPLREHEGGPEAP